MNKKNLNKKIEYSIYPQKYGISDAFSPKKSKNLKQISITILLLFLTIFCVMFFSKLFMNNRFISEADVEEIVLMNTSSNKFDIQDYVCERFIYTPSESTEDVENTVTKSIIAYKISYSDSKGVYSFVISCETGEILEHSKLMNGESIPQTKVA